MAAIDPSRGPAPPRPLLLAVVVEMGHDGSMVAAGGGSGPDLGLALTLTLTLTRRQEAMAAGGDFTDPRSERAAIPDGDHGSQGPPPPRTGRPQADSPAVASRCLPYSHGPCVGCEMRRRGRSATTDLFSAASIGLGGDPLLALLPGAPLAGHGTLAPSS